MSLAKGTRFGAYEILGPLGAGGMGEVYHARDTRLNRDVAIKTLPERTAADPERLARFRREAQVLASLNHPNIAAIYGLEESAATLALVMELVDGPTLAERIKQEGALPFDDAVEIARQVADALEYAHEKGIVHRDLKPANIKVTPDGKAKVLDFGLAKALEDSPAAADVQNSPTLSLAATRAGMILGTAAYMSPEQAKGKSVVQRADIWAFGVVLLEMLTGQQAFTGETASEVMAAVILKEPAIPAALPPGLMRLLRRCLEKDPKRRLRDIGEARFALSEEITQPAIQATVAAAAIPPPARWKALLPWGVIAALAIALGVALWNRGGQAARRTVRLSIAPPAGQQFINSSSPMVVLSPDGTRLVMELGERDFSQFYLRSLDRLEAVPLAGTKGAANAFFSPDGKWLGFTANGKLKKISVDGGSPVVLCNAEWGGGTWLPDDTIIFTPSYTHGLWRVSAEGGEPQMITAPDTAHKELGHFWPQILPGGKWVLFTIYHTAQSHVVVQSLESTERRVLVRDGNFGRYLPTGHIVYVRGETLMALPFDPSSMQVQGSATAVLEDMPVDYGNVNSQFTVAENGTLVYLPASSLHGNRQVVWVDRRGGVRPLLEMPGAYADPQLSPDGKKLALAIQDSGRMRLWTYDLERGALARLTQGKGSQFNPHWTPDGKRIFYASEDVVWQISVKSADGTGPEQLVSGGQYDRRVASIAPDGKSLLYTEGHAQTGDDIWVLPLEAGAKPAPLLLTPANEGPARLSPDGKWMAYCSNDSGRSQLYVQAYPQGARTQISTDGGCQPVWARHGRELFYRINDKVMAVALTTTPEFKASRPVLLFEGPYSYSYLNSNYDVAPDGRFVMIRKTPNASPVHAVVVLNWFEELKRKVGKKP